MAGWMTGSGEQNGLDGKREFGVSGRICSSTESGAGGEGKLRTGNRWKWGREV